MVTKFQIRNPIWNGGQPAVGLAEWKMQTEVLEFRILYRNKEGNLTFPGVYRVSRTHALKCPQKVAGFTGTMLRVIPLADCDWREGSFNTNEQGIML